MSLRSIRERINIWLYDSKSTVLMVLGVLHVTAVLTSLSLLIYLYGYPISLADKETTIRLLEYVFAFYIIRFAIYVIYDYHPVTFLKKNWFEASVMLFKASFSFYSFYRFLKEGGLKCGLKFTQHFYLHYPYYFLQLLEHSCSCFQK